MKNELEKFIENFYFHNVFKVIQDIKMDAEPAGKRSFQRSSNATTDEDISDTFSTHTTLEHKSSFERSHFDTSKTCQTVSVDRLKYRYPQDREKTSIAPDSTLTKPNYEDILRRVSIVINQHIATCEERVVKLPVDENNDAGLFRRSQIEKFSEDNFLSPQYAYHFFHFPIFAHGGLLFDIRKVPRKHEKPSLMSVHEFLVSSMLYYIQLLQTGHNYSSIGKNICGCKIIRGM